jgi:glutamate 5-kinase
MAMDKTSRTALADARRVVIKLGSHVVTKGGYALDDGLFEWLADDVAWLLERGVEVAIVSSGAVAAGLGKLGLSEPPGTIPEKQAVASVGQLNLMWNYNEVFGMRGVTVGQVLLTRHDFAHRLRYMNAKNTLLALFDRGAVPIINENDTVVVEEMKFGDNDNLSASVSNMIEADCLVILSDVAGLYDKDPKANDDARLVRCVEEVDEAVASLAEDTKTAAGSGGMTTKLTAAKRAVHGGIAAVIASGKQENMLRKIFSGEEEGTYFPAREETLSRRKHWIAYTVKATGTLTLDDGAVRAILEQGKSLLPKGVVAVEGEFDRGDAVALTNRDGQRIAKGLALYNAEETRAIAGLASWEIVDRLGYKYYDEVVHRDDLVVLDL